MNYRLFAASQLRVEVAFESNNAHARVAICHTLMELRQNQKADEVLLKQDCTTGCLLHLSIRSYEWKYIALEKLLTVQQ